MENLSVCVQSEDRKHDKFRIVEWGWNTDGSSNIYGWIGCTTYVQKIANMHRLTYEVLEFQNDCLPCVLPFSRFSPCRHDHHLPEELNHMDKSQYSIQYVYALNLPQLLTKKCHCCCHCYIFSRYKVFDLFQKRPVSKNKIQSMSSNRKKKGWGVDENVTFSNVSKTSHSLTFMQI